MVGSGSMGKVKAAHTGLFVSSLFSECQYSGGPQQKREHRSASDVAAIDGNALAPFFGALATFQARREFGMQVEPGHSWRARVQGSLP